MKALSVHDRPREKLLRIGAAGLGDNELIAIIVGSGSRHANALTLANQILESAGGLHGIPRIGADDLKRLEGMGEAKAAQVLAAVELGRRTLLRCPPKRVQFANPREIATYLLPQFGSKPVEQFGLVMLDTKHRLLRTSIISVGTLDSSPAHPREIFREALSACAACIVLFHNLSATLLQDVARRCRTRILSCFASNIARFLYHDDSRHCRGTTRFCHPGATPDNATAIGISKTDPRRATC